MDAVEALVARAASKMEPGAFRARVAELRRDTDGLLDDEALALLVLDELGLNEGAIVVLAEAASRAEATVDVLVAGAPSTRGFDRKDGTRGEVTNVPIEDASGRASLVLWDRDGEKAAGLRTGARVRIVAARVKPSRFGLELHAQPWTLLEVEGAPSAAKAKLLADVAAEPSRDLVGRVSRVLATRSFLRPEGGVGFAATLVVETPQGEAHVEVVDELVRVARALPAGTSVRVTDLLGEGARRTASTATRIERL